MPATQAKQVGALEGTMRSTTTTRKTSDMRVSPRDGITVVLLISAFIYVGHVIRSGCYNPGWQENLILSFFVTISCCAALFLGKWVNTRKASRTQPTPFSPREQPAVMPYVAAAYKNPYVSLG